MVEFSDKPRPKTKESKNKKRDTYEGVNALYEGRKLTLNAFKSGIFPIKLTPGKGLNILTTKQMLQRLPITLAQVEAVHTSEKLLNEIRQIIYSFKGEKESTKKGYNNILISIKL